MTVRVTVADPLTHRCDVLALGVFSAPGRLEGIAAKVDQALGGMLARALHEERFTGELAQVFILHTHARLPAGRIGVVGLGGRDQFTLERLRLAAAAVARAAQDRRLTRLAYPPLQHRDWEPAAIAAARTEGALLGTYQFTKYRKEKGTQVDIDLLAANRAESAAVEIGRRRGQVTADAVNYARDLVNEPANVLTPEALAAEARRITRGTKLKVQVWGPQDLKKRGMEVILAVGGASAHTPRMILLEYAPSKPRRAVALAGKGVTFDTGGVNIKPFEGMSTMKTDMAGAAAVLATMRALPLLQPPVRVTAAIVAVENAVGSRAMRPGDILTAVNGTTIEITNTDAEGRLILAEAVAHLAAGKPDEMIDVATLTGAASIALGPYAAAIMGSDQGLVDRLVAAGGRAGERLVALPLYEEYRQAMRSETADIKNSGTRPGGAQKGAIFIREFTGGVPWAHLDIAPVAYFEREEGTSPLQPKGASGFGVRTLLEYLTARS
ncbi:MAG: leucyl aminopeptidase [Armatimonadota bacterium]|nr:leucyl aminopeptidase [Armatimonadota bacterium]MDR7518387.1 leucyl aminopeptidase [Armatimonadota bacterium]